MHIILIIFTYFILFSESYATVLISDEDTFPFNCSSAGETYQLSTNISCAGNCLNITANNVTIDLNGKTITWNTGSSENTNAIQTGYNLTPVIIHSTNGKGIIADGSTGNPAGCNGIFIQESYSVVDIHDLNITVNSKSDADSSSCGIHMSRAGSGTTVNNCSVTNNALSVANRMSVPAVGINVEIDTTTTISSVLIYSNTVFSKHVGIRLHGGNEASVDRGGIQIYSNSVEIDQVSANAYAISVSGIGSSFPSGIIRNNTTTVSGNGGRGIIAVHSDNLDIYSNSVTVGEADTEESGWSNGIRIRYGLRNSQIRDNVISVLCGQSGYKAGRGIYLTAAANNDLSNPLDSNNSFERNVITVNSQDSTYECAGIILGTMEEGHNTTIECNKITTNNIGIKFYPDNTESGQVAPIVRKTSITKTTPPSGGSFYNYFFQTYNATQPISGAQILNSCYSGGALSSDFGELGDSNMEYEITGDCIECSGVILIGGASPPHTFTPAAGGPHTLTLQ